MHQACLAGRHDASLLPEDVADGCWEPEAALKMLRELGVAKANALKALHLEKVGMGPRAVQACAASEDLVWEKSWPGDSTRRCSFGPALVRLASKDPRFRDKRAAVERELADLAAKAARTKAVS